jgi:NlpC/P60 family putative phage cell wall peptidase
METRKSPPPCGEVGERSDPGGGPTRAAPPTRNSQGRISTSPQGGGNIVAIARSWIGTPYIHQASLKGVGCDCLGLLRGVWRELRGDEPETPPPYSPDWSEATGAETLYTALARHLTEVNRANLAPGDIALFRMARNAPAKHCGIIAERDRAPTLIHARQNHRVAEEPLTRHWQARLAYAFSL